MKKSIIILYGTYIFIVPTKIEDVYTDIVNEFKAKSDTSNYKLKSPLPSGKNKKEIGLMKDELDGNIKIKFVGLRPKMYSHLTND